MKIHLVGALPEDKVFLIAPDEKCHDETLVGYAVRLIHERRVVIIYHVGENVEAEYK